MTRRRFASMLAVLLALLSVGYGLAEAQRRPTGGSGLTLHEWGVWRLDPTGQRVAHLQDLARESPGFMFRVDGTTSAPLVHGAQPQPMPQPNPVRPVHPVRPQPLRPQDGPMSWTGIQPQPGTVVARKPVIFLRARQETDMSLEVRFVGGDPWLHYPSAQILRDGGEPGLRFFGRVAPAAGTRLAPAPAGHFWNGLRDVGASLFLTRDGTAEKFLFYDGPVAFGSSFTAQSDAEPPVRVLGAAETTAFRVIGSAYERWTVVPPGAGAGAALTQPMRRSGGGDLTAFRRELDRAARAQGLSAAETRSLLETWRDELFGVPGAAPPPSRLVYFITRARYDAMLPLRVSPTPDSIVRVGLVIIPRASAPTP
jgi:hypothetical protein